MKSILVITHEEFLRNALELGLAEDFNEVFSAASFEEGSYMISDYNVDLILLDCHERDFDAAEIIKKINELRTESKVITVNAEGEFGDTHLGNFTRPLEIIKLGRQIKEL